MGALGPASGGLSPEDPHSQPMVREGGACRECGRRGLVTIGWAGRQ